MEIINSSSAAERPIKPLLRWAGSKRQLLTRLKAYWRPDHHYRYIEPFVGSACLFFALRPKAAILGDTNRDLIDLYRAVKANPQPVFDRLNRIPRDADTYYRWRSKNAFAADRTTKAVRFLYLNRNCFNGIYRTNASGLFNVPFGGAHGKLVGPLERDNFMRAAIELRKARFVAGDFTRTLVSAQKGDFVYLDPPFAVSSRRVFAEYGEKVFEMNDVGRLALELRRLHKVGADFVVSYADCAAARQLTREWNATRVLVKRHIAGFSGNRRMASEWLITNQASDRMEA